MLSQILPKKGLAKHIFILWFILAVSALAFSGVYSFFPYALRTPVLAKLLNMQELFNVSLMVHVNLGVLVWFLSSSAMLMQMVIKDKFLSISFTGFIASMMGTIFIIASPFMGESEPVKNDYVPILHSLTFILGISLFLSGILLQSIITILSFDQIKRDVLKFTIYMSAMIFIVAVICFIKSAIELKAIAANRFIDLLEYYQLLFWGAGHILQFNYVQLIVFVWLAISLSSHIKVAFYLQWMNFLLVLSAVAIYWLYPLDSLELNDFFTSHMKYVGGILVMVIGIMVCYTFIARREFMLSRLDFVTFFASSFLILSGGFIGYLISGANVTVPAHYHGVILGITVGLMGLFYKILPELGFKRVNEKLAIWQILLYTIGQFIHVVALAISGGYGVLRKDPGTALSLKAKIFMGAMGIGGSIALIGGVLFVILIFKNMKRELNEF
jgi:cytochrome c oxidase subunit 1